MKNYTRAMTCAALVVTVWLHGNAACGSGLAWMNSETLDALLAEYDPPWIYHEFLEGDATPDLLPEPIGFHALDTCAETVRTQLVEKLDIEVARRYLDSAVKNRDIRRMVAATAIISSCAPDVRDLRLLLDGLDVLHRNRRTRCRYGDGEPFVYVCNTRFNRALLAACYMYVYIEWPRFLRPDVEEICTHVQFILPRAGALTEDVRRLCELLMAIQHQYTTHRAIARMRAERTIRGQGTGTWASVSYDTVVTVPSAHTSYVHELLEWSVVQGDVAKRVAVVALDYEVARWVEPAFVPLRKGPQMGTTIPLKELIHQINRACNHAYDIVVTNYCIAGQQIGVIEIGSRVRREQREAGRL